MDHILSVLVLFPVAAGLLGFIVNKESIRAYGLSVAAIEFLLSLWLWFSFDAHYPGFQFVEVLPLISSFGINYYGYHPTPALTPLRSSTHTDHPTAVANPATSVYRSVGAHLPHSRLYSWIGSIHTQQNVNTTTETLVPRLLSQGLVYRMMETEWGKDFDLTESVLLRERE